MNSEMGLSSKPRRLMALIGRPHDDRRGARHWARISRRTLHMRAIGVKRAFHCLIELAPVALFGLRASPRWFFSQLDINYLPMWALWSCGRRACVVQAQRQIHRAFAGHLDRRWPDNASSPLDHRATATSGVDKPKRDRGSEGARHAHLHAANCVAPSRSSSSDVPFRCRIRGSSPLLTAAFDVRRTSHPVAVLRAAGTTIPHSRGHRAREGGSTLYGGISQPLFATVRPPGSNGADQASWNSR
jgi:hypothetical protein